MAIKVAIAYIVVSYKWGVGSNVPGGASANNLPIDNVLAASSSDALSTDAPKVASNFSGDICRNYHDSGS